MAALVFAILLIIARWKYPQNNTRRQSTLECWRNAWEAWRDRKADEREQARNCKALRRKTVLLADPDDRSARVMTWKLESLDCNVIAVRSGSRAIREAEKARPDVVIADALLPDMSAADLYWELHISDRPIIFTGVSPDQWDNIHSLGRNVACFGKPYDPDEAAAQAGRMLRRTTANAEEA